MSIRITMEPVEPGREEVVVRYSEMTPELSAALDLLSGGGAPRRLAGVEQNAAEVGGQEQRLFAPADALYFESVDAAVYAYLPESVLRVREKLDELLTLCEPLGFVRCSRTMLVNIRRIERLRSVSGGRILATLEGGENIIISRKYAGELRGRLTAGR